MKYSDIKNNQKLNAYTNTDENICVICGSRIISRNLIVFGGGNPDYCYTCNIHRGLIKD